MPLYAVICKDRPDSLELRAANREAHLAYIRETGIVLWGGPFVVDGQPCGSLLVLDTTDHAAAKSWADGDPYGKAGLFQSVEVIEWRKVIG